MKLYCGFPPTLFIHSRKIEKLICVSCDKVLNNPVVLDCGHLCCLSCIDNNAEVQIFCKLCMIFVHSSGCESTEVAVEIDNLKVQCFCEIDSHSESDYGHCEWTGTLRDLTTIHKCLSLPEVCQNSGCEQNLSNFLMSTSHTQNCGFASVNCSLCDSKLRRKDLDNHAFNCEFRMVTCECGIELRFSDLVLHKKTACPLAVVQCSLFACGLCDLSCNGEIIRNIIDGHYLSTTLEALGNDILKKFQELQEDNVALRAASSSSQLSSSQKRLQLLKRKCAFQDDGSSKVSLTNTIQDHVELHHDKKSCALHDEQFLLVEEFKTIVTIDEVQILPEDSPQQVSMEQLSAMVEEAPTVTVKEAEEDDNTQSEQTEIDQLEEVSINTNSDHIAMEVIEELSTTGASQLQFIPICSAAIPSLQPRSDPPTIIPYVNGDTYTGQVLSDLKHGEGVMMYANGEKYKGGWAHDVREGRGVMTHVNGDVYSGEWVNNLRVGQGTLKVNSDLGYTLHAEWFNDTFDAKHVRIYRGSVLRYEGETLNHLPHGQGTMFHADGKSYLGAFQNGKRHGQGVRSRLNSTERYEGEWFKNGKSGQGIDTDAGGNVYHGEFCQGKRHGHGTLSNSTGQLLYLGHWRSGAKCGNGTEYNAHGVVLFEGSFVNDKRHTGTIVEFSDAGRTVFSGSLRDGKRQGSSVTYFYTESQDANPTRTKTGVECLTEEWVADVLQQAGWKHTLANGDSYSGIWHPNKRTGEGVIEYADGGRYEGGWNAHANGATRAVERKTSSFVVKGIMTYADKSTYIGDWLKDKRNGTGTLTFNDVDSYVGQWRDDLYHGKGVLTLNSERSTFDGHFVKGKKTGYGVYWDRHGRYQGQWKNDVWHGEGKWRKKGGEMVIGIFNYGKPPDKIQQQALATKR